MNHLALTVLLGIGSYLVARMFTERDMAVIFAILVSLLYYTLG